MGARCVAIPCGDRLRVKNVRGHHLGLVVPVRLTREHVVEVGHGLREATLTRRRQPLVNAGIDILEADAVHDVEELLAQPWCRPVDGWRFTGEQPIRLPKLRHRLIPVHRDRIPGRVAH
jgi:hypothetical protein